MENEKYTDFLCVWHVIHRRIGNKKGAKEGNKPLPCPIRRRKGIHPLSLESNAGGSEKK
jgi:hypothetical protein